MARPREASKSALLLISKTDFTASPTVNIDSVFSSKYTDYKIVVSCTTSAASGGPLIRMRTSGVDNSTSNYTNAMFRYQSDNTTGGEDAREASSLWQLTAGYAGQTTNFSIDMFQPFLSSTTHMNMIGFTSTSNTRVRSLYGSGYFSASTSFDGFAFFVVSGNMTGSIKVYGYRN